MPWVVQCVLAVAVTLVAAVPVAADPITFKLLPNYSRATFKADALLESIVGTTASAEGVAGTLIVDPAKPQGAAGVIKVDLTTLQSGVAKRDADMKGPRYLDTGTEANRYAVFEIKSVEIGGPLVAGQVSPARVRGLLVIKSKMVERTADARVRYIQLAGAQLEEQKRWGFTTDNLKITATFATMLSDHAIEVPRILFYKLSNEIQMEADLTFVR